MFKDVFIPCDLMNPNQAVDQMTSKDVEDNLHDLDCPTTQLIPKMM